MSRIEAPLNHRIRHAALAVAPCLVIALAVAAVVHAPFLGTALAFAAVLLVALAASFASRWAIGHFAKAAKMAELKGQLGEIRSR